MLNQSQTAAVMHGSGPCLVVAGPGSGKTTVLTERICYLIDSLGISEESILVVTFTKEAAQEMQRRFLWKSGRHNSKVTFGTFHSIFFQILKEELSYTTEDILSGSKRSRFLEECKKALGIQTQLSELSEDEKARISRLYESRKKEEHRLDFDDMIIKTKELLQTDPVALKRWQKRYQYFLVDEMQDMSDEQYEILRMIALPSNNLYMVGDDDQAIYGFRGANPSIMLGFEEDYPDAKRIVLHVNYRCRPMILTSAMNLIAHNKKRFPKEIKAAAKKEGSIECLEFLNPMEEAVTIANRVEVSLEKSSNDTIGILFRNRLQAIFLTEELQRREIPFFFKDSGNRLFDHFITKDVRAYLHMALDTVCREDMILVANKPDRNIPRWCMNNKFIDLEGLAMSQGKDQALYKSLLKLKDQLEILASLSPYAAVNFLLRGMGYEAYLKDLAKKRGVSYEQYEGILEALLDLSREFRDGMAFLQFLSSEQEDTTMPSGTKARVYLHTFHGAKGLEFDSVYILDVNDGITPSKHVTSEEELEEERRMFYVAMTRAKKELCFGVIQQRQNELLYPSVFLKECGIYSSSSASSRS